MPLIYLLTEADALQLPPSPSLSRDPALSVSAMNDFTIEQVSLGLIYSKVPWIVFPLSRWGPVGPSALQKWNASRVERADLTVIKEKAPKLPDMEKVASL